MKLEQTFGDSELITQTLSGDKGAYNLLVQSHQQAVRCFIASRCKYSRDVDDLAQETFITAYHKLAALNNHAIFRSWLCGIALNLVRNHHRKFNPTANSTDDALTQLITEQLENDITENENNFSLSALNDCIKALSSQAQQLINLHYLNNLSVKALSEQLELKHSTLTMRLHRTRAQLKQCISLKLESRDQ